MKVTSFTIGGGVFHPCRGVVRSFDGKEAVLRPKSAQVLAYLAERGGEVVARGELIEAVWPGIYVTENGLTQCVADIRRALGSDEPLLRTLPRRGYVLDVARTDVPARPVSAAASPRGQGGVPVLAMLPLRLPSGEDPELAVFAGVLLDGVVGSLAAMREPIVISASSTRHLGGAVEDVPAVAGRIGADYLVIGGVYRLGGRVRLSLELAEAVQGAVVWQRAYDLALESMFDAPDELATTIAHAVMPRLRDAELRTALRRRHDLGAYHLMLEGQRLMVRLERASFGEAGNMLRRAAALDPGFATPHVVLADWHSLRIGQRWSDDPAAEARALEAEVRLALELDGNQARALAVLGHNCTILYRDYDRAQSLLDRALDLAPNDSVTNLWTIPTLAYTGRAGEAVRNAERAIRLSPEDPLLFRHQHFLSMAHYANGSLEEAADWGGRSMQSNGDYISNLAVTAAVLAALGRMEESRLAAERLLSLQPAFSVRGRMTRFPHQDQGLRSRYEQHLVAAGLPV